MNCKIIVNGQEIDMTPLVSGLVSAITQSVLEAVQEAGGTTPVPVQPTPVQPTPVDPTPEPTPDIFIPANTVIVGSLPKGVMDSGPDYSERVTIGQGEIRSVAIYTTSNATNRGEFVWIQPPGVPGGSINAWLSRTPGGPPMHPNARASGRSSKYDLNYNCRGEHPDSDWLTKTGTPPTRIGSVDLNTNSKYYLNVSNVSTSTEARERNFKVKTITFGPRNT
jgi:hypothetical protein